VVPMSQNAFLNAPFAFEPIYKSFATRNGKLLSSQMLSVPDSRDSAVADTFYRFSHPLAEVYFQHDPSRSHPLFTADIMHPGVTLLTRDIRAGMSRASFFLRFSDLAEPEGDTLSMHSKATGYLISFVFSQEKLSEILIQPSE